MTINRTGSKGLMAFWADFAESDLPAFREWHNCEHMEERCSIPGFEAGRRYMGIGSAPAVLMYYETTDPAVLASDAYHARLNDPTPWTKATLPLFRNADRNVFRLLAEVGGPPRTEAPYVTTLRFNLRSGTEAEGVAWHREIWTPAVAAMPGVSRARLYHVDEVVSGIMTAERKIYGGGPGALKYLAMIETGTRDCPSFPDSNSHERLDSVIGTFWLDMALYPPSAYS